ncbi:hypothetical protein TRVA0_050S00760 [Trichomonascus vanleenenianus]|uniref:DUF3844 domain-containing protein n=1 Tax=Trichomonascus vanleenenianus TaxID=2268995 RepID=UPI003ECA0CA3
MKFSLAVTAAAIGVASAMKCEPASVFIFNSGKPKHVAHEAPVLSSDQSQLVLADAAGTSRFHTVESPEDARIVAGFGDKFSLFKHEKDSVVVAVSGVKHGETVFSKPSYTVDQTPGEGYLDELLKSMASQLAQLSGKLKHEIEEGLTLLTKELGDADKVKRCLEDVETIEGLDATVPQELAVMREVALVRAISAQTGSRHGHAMLRLKSLDQISQDKYGVAVAALQGALDELVALNSRVVIISEPENVCRMAHHKMHGRKHHSTTSKHKRDEVPSYSATVGAPAFDSKDKCKAATNNCSGRGECVKVGDRYACACKPSYNSDKRKTTRWAGRACEKKDVSVEFQMFFWTGLGILAAIVWGIKLLFSMGSEPLPGVLSAAVVSTKKA